MITLLVFTGLYLILPAFITYASVTLSRQGLLALTPFTAGMAVIWYLIEDTSARGTVTESAEVIHQAIMIAHILATLLATFFAFQAFMIGLGKCPEALLLACAEDSGVAWTAFGAAVVVAAAHITLAIIQSRRRRIWAAV